MRDSGWCGVRTRKWRVSWLVMGMVAACGYPDLPRLVDVDAPGGEADVDGPVSPPQYSSCAGLALTCGPGGTGSCCEPADPIAGGTFLRGYDAAADAYDDMNYPATVSTFLLDRYEVTVGRFRAFVEAGQGTQSNPPGAGVGAHPRLAGSGWDGAWNTSLVADTAGLKAAVKCNSTYQTWTDTPGINENKPINCVTWYEAMAFCIWDGGYLPTEAEWQYAASGGNAQRAYPWSESASALSIDCLHANYYVNNPAGTYCVGGVNRVGSEATNGDGLWRHSDLAGNVLEWGLDWYVDPFPDPQTCNDCANLTPAAARVVRGGSFDDVASSLRAAYRGSYFSPTARHYSVGLRCARTP